MKNILKKLYAHPLTRNLDIDSKEAFYIHKRIIKENQLIFEHYAFIYKHFKTAEEHLSILDFPSLEIGSGGGFLKEFLPALITSDIVKYDGIDYFEDAARLSFPDKSLKAIYANGVLHHVKEPEKCLYEIERVLVSGGLFICNEPSSSPFGYFMNRYFHNEYTNKTINEWRIKDSNRSGRLTEANMALPYIIFKRDIDLFQEKFKKLKILSIVYHDFLRYTLSGGLTYKPFIPQFLFGLVNFMEIILTPFMSILGNNMLVTIQKQ